MLAGLFGLAKSSLTEHHALGVRHMAEANSTPAKTSAPVITERDILFECPSCGKNLVVDESAEGAIVDCPRCYIKVIVPPKIQPVAAQPRPATPAPAPAAPPPPVPPPPAAPTPEISDAAGLQARGAAFGNQLKELQMQRTEIHNRVASRLNELNRDLVMLARLDATQQKLVGEWIQVVGPSKAPAGSGATPSNPPPAGSPGHTRVNFGS